MSALIFIPIFILFLISVTNFFALKKPSNNSTISDFVSVIVPLRNEAHNVEALIASLAAQTGLEHVEFILLDDNSEDGGFKLITAVIAARPNFRVLKGAPLPAGWLGKTWALQQLFEASAGEILVSIDADVRITPEAISKSITLMKSMELDFLSPYPRQLVTTWGERMIQPLLQWSWMSTLPLRIAQCSSRPSMAVANGQFFIVQKSALVAAQGYRLVRTAVLDDLYLARELLKTRSHGAVVNGADIALCRMYASWREIQSGYGKSLSDAFGSFFGALCTVAIIFLTGVAPIVLALMGSAWGWISYLLIVITRALSAIRFRSRVVDSLLHPISSALLIYLIFYSYLMRGKIQWKGRTV